MRSRTSLVTLASLGTAMTMAGAACTGGGQPAAQRPAVVDLPATKLIAALQPFDDCDGVLSYLRAEAGQRVGPYGIPGLTGGYYPMAAGAEGDAARDDVAESPATTTAGSDGAGSGGEESSGFSGTNVQEAGVDEPDIVKTDGTRIVAVAGASLFVIDATGDAPVLAGSVDLPGDAWGGRLLLDGDRALVIIDGPYPYIDFASDVAVDAVEGRPFGGSSTIQSTLVEIDLTDPANPTVVGTMTVDGTILDARQVGSTARVVVRSAPDQLPFVFPSNDSEAAQQSAAAVNATVVQEATLDDWLPHYTLERDGSTTDGLFVECGAINHPDPFAGFASVSVLTVDMAGGLAPGQSTAVLAEGQTVYASAENLYVTTSQWVDPEVLAEPKAVEEFDEDWTTQVHQFSITGDGPAAYLASGVVDGHLLNSYSMSEHEGVLRVATTEGSPWGDGGSQSGIVVLARDGEQLVTVGSVGGLGVDEQIYAVRYLGATAYVVTFRQTDPLYVVDLSNPAAPAVAGELKINGYSAYLHPVGEGLLLGVGQDADDDGRVLGLQVSLFDVTDPGNPQRLQQFVVGGGYSDAEYDPHAFLWWEPTGTAVVPMQLWRHVEDGTGGDTDDAFIGAVGVHVSPDAVTEVGRLSHAGRAPETWGDYGPPISRSLVIGDTLYTLSEAGLGAADVTTLTESAFLPFG